MPELRPFQGVRYASENLSDIVCPPYDVITQEDQEKLYARHPHNAVRVELPFSESHDETERYRKAARQFAQWLDDGVLRRDDSPCLYVYRQDFLWKGARKRITGVIGALKLEELGGRGGVLPHERTMPGPVEDRLRLLRACPVNISPIYAIYRGAGGLAPYYDSLTARPPQARLTDEHGTLHRLWVIGAPSEIEMISEAVAATALVIADGHHRYETALAYHEEQPDTNGEHDAVMCFCADADVEDLNVLPYHRVFKANSTSAAFGDRLAARFSTAEVDEEVAPRVFEHSAADHSFLVVLPDKELLLEVHEDAVSSAVGDQPAAWRSLDVVALHEAVLPAVLPEGVSQLRFSSDEEEIFRVVRDEHWTAGVLMKPLDAVQVVEVARSRMRMPQKASYFWPKAVTGLAFRSLR
ncbi:MAG: DUF1015 domain-containing protein [Actinobacteria bacterium]|nr:DUF1015 domain-containing protein [Actinomycetota bacterium]